MSIRDYTEESFNSFKRYFPKLAESSVDYYRSGSDELTIIMQDGSKIFYNELDTTIRSHGKDKAYEDRTEEDYRKEFGHRLTRKLDANRMSQSELAKLTSISTNMINLYVHGKSTPSTYSVTKIARALKCSPSEFLYFD